MEITNGADAIKALDAAVTPAEKEAAKAAVIAFMSQPGFMRRPRVSFGKAPVGGFTEADRVS